MEQRLPCYGDRLAHLGLGTDGDNLYEGLIEDALAGIGFKLQHIVDELDADEVETEKALGC
ncbi:MAG: hypothetical protein P8189_15740 [Anaerolineae bacterium]